jgi:hypothetical protein
MSEERANQFFNREYFRQSDWLDAFVKSLAQSVAPQKIINFFYFSFHVEKVAK